MKSKKKGITLVEILLSIAMIGSAAAVFGMLLNVLKINKTGSLYTAAYKIAQDEMEAMRAMPFSKLNTKTGAGFVGILFNNGNPRVAADTGAATAPNVLQISAPAAGPGLALLPFDNMAGITLETRLKTADASKESGLIFRAADLDNYYFFSIKTGRAALIKKSGGEETIIYETPQTIESDTWYKLKIIALGGNISLYLNDNRLADIFDADFSSGYAALAVFADASFDGISLAYNLENYSWNFDSAAIGSLPEDWRRFGLNDLPGGTGMLTISEPYASESLKKIDITVGWMERGENKSITLSTLRSE